MRLGVCVPNIHEALAEPATMVEVARRAEANGFDSLWVNDHVVVPTQQIGAAADRQPQYLDRRSQKILEPIVLLSFLAAHTERITLGTSVFVLALRNPVIAAKQVATLDVLSGGRTVLGVGVGWMESEFNAVNVPWNERGRRTDDALQIAKALWEGTQAGIEIAGHDLAGVEFSPLPEQRPHPPIWIGGRSPVGARRAARSGDAWHPSHLTLGELEAARRQLDELCEAAGRSPADVELTTRRRLLRSDAPSETASLRRTFEGGASDIIDDLAALEAIGVAHVLLELDAADSDGLYEQIDWLGAEVIRHPAAATGA